MWGPCVPAVHGPRGLLSLNPVFALTQERPVRRQSTAEWQDSYLNALWCLVKLGDFPLSLQAPCCLTPAIYPRFKLQLGLEAKSQPNASWLSLRKERSRQPAALGYGSPRSSPYPERVILCMVLQAAFLSLQKLHTAVVCSSVCGLVGEGIGGMWLCDV